MRVKIGHIALFLLLIIPNLAIGKDKYSRLPFRAEVLSGYEEEEVKARCDELDLQPIEGIWYYPDEDMTVVVERCINPSRDRSLDYRIVLISADDMSLLPGTVIGYCSQSADHNKYRMWIYSEQCGSLIENPQLCVGELNHERNELLIERSEMNVRVRINFSRFLPKLMKGIYAVPTKKEVKVPEGFRKIYPESAGHNGEVRYL